MWTRRAFLSAAGAGFAAGLMPRQAAALANAELVIASACQMPDRTYGAVLASERGDVIATLPLPARGHDVVRCPVTGRLAVFARRPGTFAVIFDDKGNGIHTITSPEGRHFFGHGSFSPMAACFMPPRTITRPPMARSPSSTREVISRASASSIRAASIRTR